jgi:hypothetical protein
VHCGQSAIVPLAVGAIARGEFTRKSDPKLESSIDVIDEAGHTCRLRFAHIEHVGSSRLHLVLNRVHA